MHVRQTPMLVRLVYRAASEARRGPLRRVQPNQQRPAVATSAGAVREGEVVRAALGTRRLSVTVGTTHDIAFCPRVDPFATSALLFGRIAGWFASCAAPD